ncbi:hypothetical protein HED55_05655 [Ochrobactrum haematophilum]|uniref:Cytoplasmic protein n=1 Tax=Brucella haematophila TaxID=419474 RepID=A0ABX1DJE2_9HYPH|nr:hypothetical protein [Brucella haematophila]
MHPAIWNSVRPLALVAGMMLASLPAFAAADQLALVDRSEFLTLPAYRTAPHEHPVSSPIPLPNALPHRVPSATPQNPPTGTPAPASKPMPEVLRDFDKLPQPVRQMREKMLAAAQSGDIEQLRPLLGEADNSTQLSLEDHEEDVIEFLKSLAGDVEGREILAIIADLLGTGYVHMNAGTDDEVYVWPYFYAMPLDRLTPSQTVELFQIVTASDFEDMKKAGGYIFYSIGIAPDGSWRFSPPESNHPTAPRAWLGG